jgi:hypothetical protein
MDPLMTLPKEDELRKNDDLENIRWKLWDRILTISADYGSRISLDKILDDLQIKQIVSRLSTNEDFKKKCYHEMCSWCSYLEKDKS